VEDIRNDEDDRKKYARYGVLFKNPVAATTTDDIRDALRDLIEVAVAGKDIDILALLAGWLVVASEDSTIERFKGKLERAEFVGVQERDDNDREVNRGDLQDRILERGLSGRPRFRLPPFLSAIWSSKSRANRTKN
jgi:hypothetical protein